MFRKTFLVLLALFQGGFYFLAGLWPVVDIETFQRVTGPKTDLWLVKTVGTLIAVIGLVLLFAAVRRQISPEVLLLAVASAAALAGIDITFVLQKYIPPIYLLDAFLELTLATVWILAWTLRPKEPGA